MLEVCRSVRSIRSLVTFDWNAVPCSAIFSSILSLLIRASGSVHCPLPMCGASLGAYFTVTIAWLVGMADSLISQSKVKGSAFLDIYMRSSLAWIRSFLVCALYVKALLVGFAHRHMSLMSHSCLTSLRVAVVALSSSLGGALSMASSVALKSPKVKSGIGRCLALLSIIIFAQKFVCSFLLLGVYTFSIVVMHDFSHFIFSMAALPGISSCSSISSGSISCLFMTNPTPAIAQGLSGCAEFSIIKFFWKFLPSCSVMPWSRWVSCITSIAIFSVCIVWLIVPHFPL